MRVPLGSLGLSCLLACSAPPPSHSPSALAAPRSPPSLLANTFDGTKASAQYRLLSLRPGAPLRGNLSDEQRLISGRRLLEQGGSLRLADSVAARSNLDGGRELPGFAGSGFIFWNGSGVYRARTFTGRLEPFSTLPFTVTHASFGNGFVLLRSSDGSMRVLDARTGKERAPAPLGLVDVAAADDGRVVMALELGRYAVSVDRNATLREVQDELGQPVQSLSLEPLGFVLENGSLVALSSRGELSNRGVPPRSKPTLPWPGGESALEQAVAFGVRRGALALVAQSAALVEVDLESGTVLNSGPQLLPDRPDCRLLETSGELVMKCVTRDSVVVLGQVESERPVLEQAFERRAELVSSFGYLLADRDCNGKERPYTVCVRERGGAWRTVSGSERKLAAPAATPGAPPAPSLPAPVVMSYGFKADGNVVAFVRSDKKWYQELTSGQVVELTGEGEQKTCRVEKDGVVRCLSPQGSTWFGLDGNLRPSPLDFSWVASAGEHALAFDHDGKLFQSDDWGRSWREVALPPQQDPPIDKNMQCSGVGCRFGGWLRIGWEPLPPEPKRPPELVPLPAATELSRPVLACVGQAEPKPRLARSTGDEEVRGFGVELVSAQRIAMNIESTAPSQTSHGSFGLRGVVTSERLSDLIPSDAEARAPSKALRLRYVDYFDAKPAKVQATFSMQEWARALSLTGTGVGSFSFDDELTFQGVPVLSSDTGKAAGFIMTLEQSPIWVIGSRALPLPLERSTGSEVVVSAVAEKSGGLLLLLDDGRVVRYSQGNTVTLFRVPPNLGVAREHATADALSVTPEGDVAVLRFSSGPEAPTTAYPVLAYRPGKPPEALAPFAQLLPASDPACARPSGYRAIVLASRSWLQLSRGAEQSIDDDWGLTALVRWSSERVCLEAVELPDASFGITREPLLTRVVAVLGPKPRAARLGFGPGVELEQPLACELRR